MDDITEVTSDLIENIAPTNGSFVGKFILGCTTVVGGFVIGRTLLRGMRSKKAESKVSAPTVIETTAR